MKGAQRIRDIFAGVCCIKDWPSDHHHQKLRFTLSDGKARKNRGNTFWQRRTKKTHSSHSKVWMGSFARLFDKDNFFAGLEVLLSF